MYVQYTIFYCCYITAAVFQLFIFDLPLVVYQTCSIKASMHIIFSVSNNCEMIIAQPWCAVIIDVLISYT